MSAALHDTEATRSQSPSPTYTRRLDGVVVVTSTLVVLYHRPKLRKVRLELLFFHEVRVAMIQAWVGRVGRGNLPR